MVRIQSTIGNSGFDAGGKNFVVNDESPGAAQRASTGARQPVPQGQVQQGRQIDPSVVAGMRRQAIEQQEQVEQRALLEAKRRVEILTGLGRKTKDVEVESLVFTLRTLKTFESERLAQTIQSQERVTMPNGMVSFTPLGMFAIKVETLSHALFMVDGQPLDVVLGTVGEDYHSQVNARRDLVNEMDNTLIDYLFVQYEALSKEVQDGYAPKTAEEVKEVVDTVRKSGEDA